MTIFLILTGVTLLLVAWFVQSHNQKVERLRVSEQQARAVRALAEHGEGMSTMADTTPHASFVPPPLNRSERMEMVFCEIGDRIDEEVFACDGLSEHSQELREAVEQVLVEARWVAREARRLTGVQPVASEAEQLAA